MTLTELWGPTSTPPLLQYQTLQQQFASCQSPFQHDLHYNLSSHKLLPRPSHVFDASDNGEQHAGAHHADRPGGLGLHAPISRTHVALMHTHPHIMFPLWTSSPSSHTPARTQSFLRGPFVLDSIELNIPESTPPKNFLS